MLSLIVAFPKLEDAKNLKNVLKRCGFTDVFACNSASQVISTANELDDGIVISGYRLSDMHYSELFGYLPREFPMLLVASPAKLEECANQEIVCLGMPIKTNELIQTLNTMLQACQRERRQKRTVRNRRTEQEKKTIGDAKALLMSRDNMTEEEAHRYIQKISMDSGNNLVETAEMILAFE